MAPSPSLGRNSPPMREASNTAPTSSASAPSEHELAEAQRQAQHRLVKPMGQPHQPRLLFLHLLGQEQARQHRRQRQRQNQRAEQREDHRQRHRLEQFSFDAFQREDGQEHDEDDAHAEGHGPRHFERGAGQRFLRAPASVSARPSSRWRSARRRMAFSTITTAPSTMQAEVHRAQAQQAGGDAGLQHQVAGEQHRERNGRRHDQPGAQIAQEGEQDGDHQQRARQQVVLDGADDVVHQFRAVVEHLELDVLGQHLLHFGQLRLERARHHGAVFAHEHEAQAQHDLSPAGRRSPRRGGFRGPPAPWPRRARARARRRAR